MNSLPISVNTAIEAKGLLDEYIESLKAVEGTRAILTKLEGRHAATCAKLAATGIFGVTSPISEPSAAIVADALLPVEPVVIESPVVKTAVEPTPAPDDVPVADELPQPVPTVPVITEIVTEEVKPAVVATPRPTICPGFNMKSCGSPVGKQSKTGLCHKCAVARGIANMTPESKAERNQKRADSLVRNRADAQIHTDGMPKPKSDEIGGDISEQDVPPMPSTIIAELMSGRRHESFMAARSMAINHRTSIEAGVVTLYWELGTAFMQSKLPPMWHFAHAPEAKDTSLPEVIEVIRLEGNTWVTGPEKTVIGRVNISGTGGAF